MSNERKPIDKSLRNTVLSKIFITISITTVIFFIFLAIAYIICHMFTFKGDEPIYILGGIIKYVFPFILIVIWFVEILIIIISYWKKALRYTDIIIEESKKLIKNDDEKVELPLELKDVEEQMNSVKQIAIKNMQLAKEEEQRKNDLIFYLAHDLKTPLTSVIGYLTLLNDEKEISKELRERYLAISLDKAERLEELINEFFEITRFNLSRLILESQEVNLTRMIEQIAYEFKPLFKEKNIECKLKIESNLKIKCDVNKMERVFDNLIRNAINYSFDNAIVEIEAKRYKNKIYMCFINEGNTIPVEKLERIFEQFYRLDSSRESKKGGSGLGLAIAKKIIELHNGTIKANSADNKIKFEILIPES